MKIKKVLAGMMMCLAMAPDFVTFLSSKIRMPDFHQYRQIQG